MIGGRVHGRPRIFASDPAKKHPEKFEFD